MIVIPLVFAAVGVAFTALGIGIQRGNRRFEQAAAPATATVVDVRRRAAGSRSARGLIWVPVVRFRTADGRTIEVETTSGTNVRRHEPGQSLDVLYDPANPQDVRIPDDLASSLVPGLFVALGLTFAILGLAILAVLAAT